MALRPNSYTHENYAPCPKKNSAVSFLSEIRRISTNVDNYWHNDGKEDG